MQPECNAHTHKLQCINTMVDTEKWSNALFARRHIMPVWPNYWIHHMNCFHCVLPFFTNKSRATHTHTIGYPISIRDANKMYIIRRFGCYLHRFLPASDYCTDMKNASNDRDWLCVVTEWRCPFRLHFPIMQISKRAHPNNSHLYSDLLLFFSLFFHYYYCVFVHYKTRIKKKRRIAILVTCDLYFEWWFHYLFYGFSVCGHIESSTRPSGVYLNDFFLFVINSCIFFCAAVSVHFLYILYSIESIQWTHIVIGLICRLFFVFSLLRFCNVYGRTMTCDWLANSCSVALARRSPKERCSWTCCEFFALSTNWIMAKWTEAFMVNSVSFIDDDVLCTYAYNTFFCIHCATRSATYIYFLLDSIWLDRLFFLECGIFLLIVIASQRLTTKSITYGSTTILIIFRVNYTSRTWCRCPISG